MERLSHDLNLALEESNCGRDNRCRIGLRRRTRSAGNLPAAVSVSIAQDDSSSSPPQALVTQPTDSDDPHSDHTASIKSRHYCSIINVESDSFNENFSPTRNNNRRKRKFKKIPVECADADASPVEIISLTTEISLIPTPSTSTHPNNSNAHHIMRNKKTSLSKERSTFCGKRKWSHRGEVSEMRERSFSGGCASKRSPALSKSYDFLKKGADKRRKDAVLQPGKIVLPARDAPPPSIGFRFVYRGTTPTRAPAPAPAPPAPEAATMECGDDSSSISSSDAESVLTNDSDREGDDELTDWPGIEELKVFNKTLSFRAPKPAPGQPMPPPKRLKKEKLLAKSGWASCKNRFKKKRVKVDSDNENEAIMSDPSAAAEPPAGLRPPQNLSSFSDIKRAGAKGENANETFYLSFRAFEEKAAGHQEPVARARSTPPLQNTSSGEAELGSGGGLCAALARQAREIRAGCRRVRDARPALLIHSAQAEQLSRFLQDARARELRLPAPHARAEADSLRDLADLYSLELRNERMRILLIKTSKTTQAVHATVEQSYAALVSDHKRRCYGECGLGGGCGEAAAVSAGAGGGGEGVADSFSRSLVARSLLDPGDVD